MGKRVEGQKRKPNRNPMGFLADTQKKPKVNPARKLLIDQITVLHYVQNSHVPSRAATASILSRHGWPTHPEPATRKPRRSKRGRPGLPMARRCKPSWTA